MDKSIIVSIIALCCFTAASAQNYRDSRYYNPQSGHLDYGHQSGHSDYGHQPGHSDYGHQPGHSDYGRPSEPASRDRERHRFGRHDDKDYYVGLRIGPNFSHVSSDDAYLDGGTIKTGLNIGVAFGRRIVSDNPLYFESGLYYSEKGGKGNGGTDGGKFTYSLNYLELPLLMKYRYSIDDHFRVEPYFGGYFAVGLGGQIKNFGEREAYSSFSSSDKASFQRCDAGLKFGVGASYDIFYMELGYDLGLTNICHDYFDTSHNGALQLNFGINI